MSPLVCKAVDEKVPFVQKECIAQFQVLVLLVQGSVSGQKFCGKVALGQESGTKGCGDESASVDDHERGLTTRVA